MTREQRRLKPGEVRAVEKDGQKFIELQIVVPYVVDDYGSVWMEDAFDESLDERMPTLCWAHDWSEPIGRGVEWTRAKGEGPKVLFRLDDFDAVPMARRAYAQVQPGPNGEPATIDECSVGFSDVTRRDPTDDEMVKWPGAREVIEKASNDEDSLVLRGAVPGAKVLAYRSAGATATVSEDAVIDLAKKVEAGEMTKAEAAIALDLLAGAEREEEQPGDAELAAELDAIEHEADEALGLL